MVTPELICDQTFAQTCFCAQTPGGQKAVHALCWMGEGRGHLDVPRLVGAQVQALPTPCPVLSAGVGGAGGQHLSFPHVLARFQRVLICKAGTREGVVWQRDPSHGTLSRGPARPRTLTIPWCP